MTPNEYQQLALRTETNGTPDFVRAPGSEVNDRTYSRLIHGLIGMCTETGEAQDMVKKALIYGKPFDAVNVLEECGDTLWYIALALDAVGFTMEQAMGRNIEKLKKRYPDRFSVEAALNRDLDKERAALDPK